LGQKLQLGADITVTVLEAHGNRVRLGIDAPTHVSVLRSEVAHLSPPAPSSAVCKALAGAAALEEGT
jgi:carbon storage regulator